MSHYSTRRDGTRVRWLSCAETAAEVRAALKAAFPDTRFSVRSDTYAGGGSVRVEWVEGPALREVERVAQAFEGATFDGMQDLKSHHDSTLRGEAVSYGADYVFCQRLSQEEAARKSAWKAVVEARRVRRRQARAAAS